MGLLLKYGFSVEMAIDRTNQTLLVGGNVEKMEFPHLLALWGRVNLLEQYCEMGYDPNRFFICGITINYRLDIHEQAKFTCLDLLSNRVEKTVWDEFSIGFGATSFGGGLDFILPRQHLKSRSISAGYEFSIDKSFTNYLASGTFTLAPCLFFASPSQSGYQYRPILLAFVSWAIAENVPDWYLSGLIAKLIAKGADPLVKGTMGVGIKTETSNTLMFVAKSGGYPLSLQTILDYAEVPADQEQAARKHLPKPLKPSSGSGKTVCACLAAMAGLAVTAMAVNALFL